MRATIIYDADGRIYSVNYGETINPVGLKSAIVDVPENVQSIDHMNGDEPVFKFIPEAALTSFEKSVSSIYKELRDALDANHKIQIVLSENLTDEQALKIKEIYPEWSGDGVSYALNERVNYKKHLWKVITAHTSQSNWTPDYSPSLFSKIINESTADEPVEWEQPNPTNPYLEGDKVIHNGKVWVSLVDGNVWEPGTIGTESIWKEVLEDE